MKKFNTNIFSTEEQITAKELLNSINLKSEKNQVTYFLSEFEQVVLKKIVSSSNAKIEFFGGLEFSERKRAKIIFNDYYDVDYDVVLLYAKVNTKFYDVAHRNVLGAIHKLGINYNRFGDILVKDGEIFLLVSAEIVDYIIFNFQKIGKASVEFKEISIEDINISREYEEKNIVVSSLRLDNIIAKITNKSRSVVKEMLEKEFIKINHSLTKNAQKICEVNDMLSIRKYGRFTISEINQNSKSLKYRIVVRKLV